jgi:glycosyltransferase involved in cell wall biosynthesis
MLGGFVTWIETLIEPNRKTSRAAQPLSNLMMTTPSSRMRLRLLAIMEGSKVSGPAKNLLEFCRIVRDLPEGPIIEPTLLLFQRTQKGVSARQPARNELLEQALAYNLPVHCIPERFTFDRQVVGYLKRVVDQVAPDIIQTHMFKSHFLVRACGLHKRRAWVAFFHGYTSTTFKRDLLAQLDRWSLRAPSQIVAVSEAFSRRLAARGVPRERTTVLHNAIDPAWLQIEAEDCDPAGIESATAVQCGEKLVLAVGRLSREKGFTDLVAAIRDLNEMRPERLVRLLIAGEGLERRSIEEAIRRAGLEQQVTLLGHVKDVRPYYRAADVFAISSLSEGSPNALLEAMAAGVPVVATAVGGIPEIATDGETALLVPARNPRALAAALDRLLSDRSLAKAIAGRASELINRKYSPLSRAKSLVRLYERLCPSSQADSGACLRQADHPASAGVDEKSSLGVI